MNLIPGSCEPKLRRPPPDLAAWLSRLHAECDPQAIRRIVEALPAPRSRLHAPDAMRQADDYLLAGFEQRGWRVRRSTYTFHGVRGYLDYGDDPAFSMRTEFARLDGANIVAVREGVASSEAIVVTAHHDTIRDSPGADDNTASVAVLLEVARLLRGSRFERTIVLAATDMEELGFFGARALLREVSSDRRIVGAINFETMGYTDSAAGSQFLPPGIGMIYPDQVRRIRRRVFRGDFTAVIYNGKATGLASALGTALAEIEGETATLLLRDPNDLPVLGGLLGRAVPAVRNFARSDHVPFWEAGLPALMVTDTANFRNPHYHRASDTPEKLDYRRLAAIAAASAYAVAVVAGVLDRA